jgi:hypothetical protein
MMRSHKIPKKIRNIFVPKEMLGTYTDVHQYWRAYHNARRKQLREQVIEFLGGKCCKCGFSDWRALQVDHVNGGGCHEIRTTHKETYWKRILKGEEKGKYQLLCANCNWIKRYTNDELKNCGHKKFLGV